MWIFFLLSLIGLLVQVLFVTLALAAGLYYLAELVEEYSVSAGKIIRWIIMGELVIHFGLFFENLPTTLVIGGIIHHAANLTLMKNFPFFDFLSPGFLVSMATLVYNHYLAFSHFENHYYSFTEVIGFFTVCLWLIPFAFLVSLSANENVLPTLAETRPLLNDDDVMSNYFSKKKQKWGLLAMLNYAKENLLPSRSKKLF